MNKRHSCIYASGNGANKFICELHHKPCLCQRWCTADRRYKPTACIEECKKFKS